MGRQPNTDNSYVKLERGLFGALPQLHAVLVRSDPEGAELKVKQRGEMDWIALCKRYGPDGGPQIAFGTGYDLVAALLGLEGAVAANRWREDRPWSQRG